MGERLIQVSLFFLRFSLRSSLHLRLYVTFSSGCYAICVTPYVCWVCCWFSPLLREGFLRVLRFSPLLKNQHFQIPIRPGPGRRRTTLWMCYLQIIICSFIYLFIYLFIYTFVMFSICSPQTRPSIFLWWTSRLLTIKPGYQTTPDHQIRP